MKLELIGIFKTRVYSYFPQNFSDSLMIFQQSAVDEWVEMSRICLGLLLKCSQHPNPEIVAMATAKLHTVLQVRATEDLPELSYLMFSINKALNAAIEGTCTLHTDISVEVRSFNSFSSITCPF